MNTKQPKALQLAECLEQPDYCTLAQMRRAAALLRTQHALLERALDALKAYSRWGASLDVEMKAENAINDIESHLEKP